MKRTLTIAVASVALAVLTVFGISGPVQPAQATVAPPATLAVADPTPTPSPCLDGLVCHHILPSETDGPLNDGSDPCDGKTGPGIGCGGADQWGNENDTTDNGINDGNNDGLNIEHYLYLPPFLTESGKLLVYLAGGNGSARGGVNVYPVAARQGYHVIGLTYPAAQANGPCGKNTLSEQEQLDCYGNAFREVVTGEDSSPSAGSDVSTVSLHRQDTIVNRLLKVLQWAHKNYPDKGWDKYLTASGDVDWTQVHLAGHSNGTSHSSFMAQLARFRDIGRVALFAGPDDGNGGETEDEWNPATYIQNPEVPTADRYYGLVHELNKARKINSGIEVDPPPIYQVLKNWHTFGMEDRLVSRFGFDPDPFFTPYFGDAHFLLSKDPERRVANATSLGTTKGESHGSVVEDRYCIEENEQFNCVTHGTDSIGYKPAWRCILGTGDFYASAIPIANAGADQTVECEGGGANVVLNGSGTTDPDCEVLTYEWTGSFGAATGRKPTVFLPVGTHLVTLVVKDPWSSSAPDMTSITVSDTEPPTISCPADIVLEPTCSSGAVATYTTPVGADVCAEAITTRTAGLASGSIFPIGTTTVTYTATDASSNTASCSFNVKVLTAAEVIQDLISRVQALQPPLSGQQAQGLRSKLNAALFAIVTDQKNVPCNKLNDFISQVQTYLNNGKLTSAQGQPLINSAAHVRNTLGCIALGCT